MSAAATGSQTPGGPDSSDPGVAYRATSIAKILDQPPPTSEQIAVIEAPVRPLLVVAGAGSGKTETMAARVVYLVANRLVAPGEVLGLTFTRKAAAELSDRIRLRLRQLHQAGVGLEDGLAERPRIATYNSYAASVLSDHALRMGWDPDATLISDAGRFQVADQIVRDWPEDIETSYAVATVVDAVTELAGQLAEHGLTPAQAADHLSRLARDLITKEGKRPLKDVAQIADSLRLRSRLMDLVSHFEARKRTDGVVDFADQVRMAATIAAEEPKVGALERSRYSVVLLDEYQDTSIAQVDLLRSLFGTGHPVTAVGDPNQAIYGWRGAAAGTLLAFPEDFPERDGAPARVMNLSTAWRNDLAILAAANQVAAPLRSGPATQHVSALQPAPQAGPGVVEAHYLQTQLEEAEQIATLLARYWSDDQKAPATAAVLCRKRAQFAPIEAALAEAGLPCQVIGLGGLLATAEVADIRAALTVAQDPSRGEAMMRLLTGPSVHLGAADLAVLHAWSKVQAGPRRSTAGPGTRHAHPAADGARSAGDDEEVVLEEVEQASLVEAVDSLPPEHFQTYSLSAAGRYRLERLSRQIKQIRSLTYLTMPELVTATEQILGLDIDVAAHVPGSVGHARRNLDAFTNAAASFAGGTEEPTLGAFLAYLDAVEDEERGMDVVVAEPDPGAIQIMTVHAAKGLEWDTVVVAGLNTADFPSIAPNKAGELVANGWTTSVASLPYPLRGDRDWLPELDIEGTHTHQEMAEARAEFRRREGQRELAEERRLAYVAMTRARHTLLLTGYFWGTRSTPSEPSTFLAPLVAGGLARTVAPWPAQPEQEINPITAAAPSTPWPQPARAAAQQWEQIWAEAAEPQTLPLDLSPSRRWWQEAELLLAERDAAQQLRVPVPEHLSASAVVELAADPQAFLRDRRRPVPRRPSAAARRGTRFHAWVEQYFGTQTLLDWDALPGADDGDPDTALADLQSAFLASSWAQREPIAVEVDIETIVAGIAVRSRIDAVFAEGEGVHVVDWKTGRPPTTVAEQRTKQIQLALYRLAWARLHQLPVESVRASFHYVAEQETVTAEPLGEAELEAMLAGAWDGGEPPAP